MAVLTTQSGWWERSYISDYACVVVLLLVTEIINYCVEPYCRFYSKHIDGSFDYPLQSETVPAWALIVGSIGLPSALFFCTQRWHPNKHDLHHAFLTLFQGLVLTEVVTVAAKLYAGRYRPDWMARVRGQNFKVGDVIDYCTVHELSAGRKSFPSGHSSTSFAASTIMFLYLAGKCRLFAERRGHMYKLLVCLSPFLWGGFVSISRTRDYYHDFDDIAVGAIIGTVIASLCYFLNYPGLSSRKSESPVNRADGINSFSRCRGDDVERAYETIGSHDADDV